MSDVSVIRVGWWRTRRGNIYLVHGIVPWKTEWPLIVSVDGNIDVRYTVDGKRKTEGETRDDLVEFLPDCDSFEWKPEVFPQYWTVIGAAKGIHAFIRLDSPQKLSSVDMKGYENYSDFQIHGKFSRKRMISEGRTELTKEEAESLVTPLEVFPQYWTTLDRESNRLEATAFVIRANKVDWNLVMKNGDHGICMGGTSKWDPRERTQLTKEQAEALLLPKESPDDWVVQDRVPARAEIDRGHFGNKGRSPEDMWGFVSESVGVGEMHGHHGMVVYCRRKDLPETKAETRTVVITRWLCWNEDGKARLIHAENRPTGFLNCENRGDEKFEVKP